MITITTVRPSDAREFWPWAESLLGQNIREGGRFRPEEVLQKIEEDRFSLWMAGGPPPDSVAVVQLLQYPRRRDAKIIFAGGRLESIVEHLEVLEDWARERGARGLEIETPREGWERVLPGFRRAAVVLRKELVQ